MAETDTVFGWYTDGTLMADTDTVFSQHNRLKKQGYSAFG